MNSRFALAAAALAAALSCAAQAQDAAAEPKVPQRGGEPKVQHIVIEDQGARIEELRIRGQTQRIVVQPKVRGAKPYEIVPATQGRDMSYSADPQRGAAGQRVWNVLNF